MSIHFLILAAFKFKTLIPIYLLLLLLLSFLFFYVELCITSDSFWSKVLFLFFFSKKIRVFSGASSKQENTVEFREI